jgi:hypothetical protein
MPGRGDPFRAALVAQLEFTAGARAERHERSPERRRFRYRQRVYIVALMALRTSVEEEAPLLAADLGSTAYETALILRAPTPIPLLRTADRARALDLLAKLRARGHDAVACDAAAVVPASSMMHVRSFRFEPEGLVVGAHGHVDEERAPWGDVLAFVRATHRTRTEHTEKTDERKLSIGRAAMSGGLLMTKTVSKTTTQRTEEREQVLYVFRRGGSPLLVSQSHARYERLGAELRPSQLENFTTLVRLLREHAPGAAYDERLLAPRPQVDSVRAGGGGRVSASSSDGVDLLAHLIALASARAPRP